MLPAPPSGPTRKGIIVIHGVGALPQSGTLLDMGQPLLKWVAAWAKARGWRARFSAARLSFNPIDDGLKRDPPHATLEVDDPAGQRALTWVMAEVWWSYSVRRPAFGEIFQWAWRQIGAVFLELRDANAKRFRRIGKPKPGASHPTSAWMRWVNAVNAAVLIPAFFVVGIALIVPVLLLGVLALIPIPALQNFIAVHPLRQFLVANIAQFRIFLDDGVEPANMRRRLEDVMAWLLTEQRCQELYVLGYSEGAVLAVDTLGRLQNPAIVGPVRKLFTFGAGLNKAWLLGHDPARFPRPLPAHIHWVDFWTSYDPFPAGSLSPRPPTPYIYEPAATTRLKASPPNAVSPAPLPAEHAPGVGGPVTEEITGEMDLVSDHGAYWHNHEEFLARLAQEIDAPQFWESSFWPGRALHLDLAARLWMRVSVLVAMRLFATALGIATLALQWSNLSAIGPAIWDGLLKVPGFDRLIDPFFGLLYQAMAVLSESWAQGARGVSLWLLAVGAIAAVYVAVYEAGKQLVWARMHAREQAESVVRMAQASNAADAQLAPWPSFWGPSMWAWLIFLLAIPVFVGWLSGLVVPTAVAQLAGVS